MNLAHSFRSCSVLLVLAVAGVAGANARAVELITTSPFLPPNSAESSATPANSPLELHGILDTPDGYKFNLCDPSGHINVWVGLNATDHPFVVRTHDAAHSRVTVEYQGRELTLALAQPKITPMSIPQQFAPMPQPMMQPGGVNGGPSDQSVQLQRIAEEIRRRRALRASMQMQQFPPGVNRPGMPPQPQP